MAGDTRTLKVVVTGDSSGARRALRDVGDESGKTHGKLAGLGRFMAEWGTKGALALGAAGGAAAIMGIKTASGMEQARNAFTNMLGSATKADKFLKGLSDFAAKTPFEFPELVSSSQQLMAMGISADQVIPTLTAVGDAVAGMGGNGENVALITRALGQMQAKGRVAGEEILQITEQGVPALKILADGYGVTTGELQKMMAGGKILSDKAIPMLVKGLESGTKSTKGFGGMMAQQSTTVQGRWSTMMDTIRMGLGNLTAKAFPVMNRAMVAVTDGAEAFFKSLESGKATGDGFVGWASTAGVKVKEFAAWLRTDGVEMAKRFWQELQNVADRVRNVIDWLREHQDLVKAVAAVIAGLIVVERVHTGVMLVKKGLMMIHNGQLAAYLLKSKLIRGATLVWSAAQWLLNGALSANPIALVIIGIAALVGAIILAYKNSETFRKIVKFTWESIQKVIKWAWDSVIKPVFGWLRKAMQQSGGDMERLGKIIGQVWGWIKSHFDGGVKTVVRFFLNMVAILLQGASKAFGWIPGIGPKLKEAARKFNTFRDDVNRSLNGVKDKNVTLRATFDAQVAKLKASGVKGHINVGLFKRGGPVNGGVPGKDSVPALLAPNEFVIRDDGSNLPDAMAYYGAKRFARGGLVVNTRVPSASTISREGNAGTAGMVREAGPYLARWAKNVFVGPPANVGSGVARWAPLVLQVLGMLGQPAYLLAAVLRRINLESGGNPFAINLWDSNARAGYPSQGLMQTIPQTFYAYANGFRHLGITNPLANIYAGLNYAIRRYGSIRAIDPLIRPTGYDQGGPLKPGYTLAYNGTGHDEWVSTRRPGGGNIIIEKLIVQGSVITERDLIKALSLGLRDELLRHAHRNGGRTGLPGK